MQAIAETLFDIVYLTTVITLGVRMIRGVQGQSPVPAVRHHGSRTGFRVTRSIWFPVPWLSAPPAWKTTPLPWASASWLPR